MCQASFENVYIGKELTSNETTPKVDPVQAIFLRVHVTERYHRGEGHFTQK